MSLVYNVDIDVLLRICIEANTSKVITMDCETNLSRLVEHDDWMCKERVQINESIQGIKNSVSNICMAIEAFSNAVNDNANKYIELLNIEANAAMSIEQDLQSQYAESCATTNFELSSGTHFNSLVNNIDYSGIESIPSAAIYNMDQPICMVDFESYRS